MSDRPHPRRPTRVAAGRRGETPQSMTVQSTTAAPAPAPPGTAPTRRRRPRSQSRRPRTAAIALRWATLVVLVGGWQLALGGGKSHDYFAPPSAIISDGVPYLGSTAGIDGLWATAQEFLIAFFIAAVVGILLGVLLGLSRHVAPVAGDTVYLLYTLPQVPFYPLFVLYFGVGRSSEIAFGVTHGVMPILLTVIAATSRVDPDLLTAAHSMGADRRMRIRCIILPAIVPELMTALRVGAALTLIGVVIGQVLVSVDGVGGLIGQLSGNLQAAPLDAVVLAVCIAAILVNSGLRVAERRLSRWRT